MKGPACFAKTRVCYSSKLVSVSEKEFPEFPSTLGVDEVIDCLRMRWSVSYDIQLVV